MPARTLPNLGLKAFFDLGEDGWDDEMNLNLLILSVLAQGRAISHVSVTPLSPANGDVYIFSNTHPTEPNKVAIRDASAWIYLPPFSGWKLFNTTTELYEVFNGTVWVPINLGGVEEAPINGNFYARRNAEWEDFNPAGGGGGGMLNLIERLDLAGLNTLTSAAIPTTFKKLRFEGSVYGAAGASTNLRVRLNGDSAANYAQQRVGAANGSSVVQSLSQTSMIFDGLVPVIGGATTQANSFIMQCNHYLGDYGKSFYSSFATGGATAAGSGSQIVLDFANNWYNTADIATATFFLASGNFAPGSYVDIIGIE